jgi:MoaA/NifB/PqqE/SkfB family radical SAM enzyme
MDIKKSIIRETFNQIVLNKPLRKLAVRKLDKMLHNSLINGYGVPALPAEKKQKYYYLSSIMHTVSHHLDNGFINPKVTRKMVDVFTQGGLKTDRVRTLNPAKETYKEKYGEYPPLFCVLSPTKACNLACVGCYATSDRQSTPKLDYETTRKVVQDVHDTFGSRFMTISGGEPFMYKDGGKTIYDIFEEFNDMFFLTYTNATLIDEKVARRLAELGNVTPCISVEGFEKETDERRGKGVYQKIMNAMQYLRDYGVPYGMSVTATSKNIDILLTEEFYDYYFNELGITYVFQFQMMPVGRGKEVIDLMITPQQRVDLYHLWKKLLCDKRYPIADFWNSGAVVDGCLAYGRWSGYFYVNWYGNVMPCVFVPYYKDNVKDLYAQGKNLGDALQSKFFKNGRQWQKDVGFGNPHKKKNVLMPCSIKDHWDNFKENILTDDVTGENPDAESMKNDPVYDDILRKYDEALERLTMKIFIDDYLQEFRETIQTEIA